MSSKNPWLLVGAIILCVIAFTSLYVTASSYFEGIANSEESNLANLYSSINTKATDANCRYLLTSIKARAGIYRSITTQDEESLRKCGDLVREVAEKNVKKASAIKVTCPADISGNGTVDSDDLNVVLSAWGTSDPLADVTDNGTVDVDDLIFVINKWGPCDGGSSVPQQGLALWYKFEGNQNDSSPNGNHGSCSGSNCPVYSVNGGQGNSGAYQFDGSDDYIFAQDSASLDLSTSGTIAAHVYLDNMSDWHGVIAKGSGNNDQGHNYALEITNTDDRAVCVVGDGTSGKNIKGATTLLANTSYHLACKWDNGVLTVYVNGQVDGSTTYTFTPQGNTSNLLVGAYGGNASNPQLDELQGIIDSVLVYNRALSDAEISAISGGTTPPPPPPPPPPQLCGNGVINSGEQCDGTNLNGYTCSTLGGYTGGTLSCNSNCTFNTTQCTLPPTQCSDTQDNDGDGFVDMTDPGCSSPQDNNEINGASGPVIHPGQGWSGPTTPPTGTGPEPIATWSSVPYQVFNDEITAGVIAFHKNGIDRVEFAVNGGEWLPVTEMTLNPETDVYEYWVKLDASEFGPNQTAEVRAIAYPEFGGKPVLVAYDFTVNGGTIVPNLKYTANFVGQTRFVSATGGSWATSTCGTTSANPCANLATGAKAVENAQGGNAGGGLVYLLPGTTYEIQDTQNIVTTGKWLTVSAAPNLDPEDVVFKHVGGAGADIGDPLSAGLWHFKNIKVQGAAHPSNPYLPNHQFEPLGGGLWAEGIEFIGVNNDDDSGGVWETDNIEQGIFYTESTFKHMSQPFTEITFIRNVIAHDIGNDLFKHPKTVINVEATWNGHTSCDDCHADFMQFSVDENPSQKNIIFYNVTSYDAHQDTQGFYFGGDGEEQFTNIAAVNVLIERYGDSSSRSHLLDANYDHVLFWHVTHDTINMSLDGSATFSNLSVVGGSWENFLLGDSSLQTNFKDNHYEFGTAWGTETSTGNPGYVNPNNNDYHPNNTSVLRNRVTPLLNVADAEGLLRGTPSAAGALKWSGE